jgi:uncharacterized protein (TIGR00730 family)
MKKVRSYVLADQDMAFLNHDDRRGVRLELEYLKAEALLREHRVRHTILVMGSTRTARGDPWYRIAREFGRIVGRSRGAALMTGGGPGIMEAANRGALEAGGLSIGMNIDLPVPQRANRYCTPGLSLRFRYFALRKLHFLLRARALVAFPGGFGTFDELFETLTLVQTRKIRPIPIVLVGEAWWRRAVDFDFLCSQGMIRDADRTIFSYAENAREIQRAIQRRLPPSETRIKPIPAASSDANRSDSKEARGVIGTSASRRSSRPTARAIGRASGRVASASKVQALKPRPSHSHSGAA